MMMIRSTALLDSQEYVLFVAIGGVRAGNRPSNAEPRLLLRQKVHVQPSSAVLLWQAAVHHTQRREVLQLPEQVRITAITCV